MRLLMTNHRSISQRLRRAKSLKVKQLTALDWATNWQQEQLQLIALLEQAIKQNNYDQLCIATGQLKAVSNKRFDALNNVLKLLSEENSIL